MVNMRIKPVLIIFLVLAIGLVATFFSGFYEQNLSEPGLSKVGYGFPLTWHGHSQIVFPDMPTIYWFSLESFLLDAAFWCLIFIFFFLISSWLSKQGSYISNKN
jgi:hypothetical protein